MTESLDKPKKRVLGLTGNMWIYAFGVMGINLAIGLVNSYQAEFFDKIMRLNLAYYSCGKVYKYRCRLRNRKSH